MSPIRLGVAHTPLGRFHIAVAEDAVLRITLPSDGRSHMTDWLERNFPGMPVVEEAHPLIQAAAEQLDEWARGSRRTFDLPLQLVGTEFQKAVWNALSEIPYGEVRSYGQIAQSVGKPGAARAVGQANNRNHLAPVIPCHRVVASGGALGGYGGGIELKQRMLELERDH